MHDIRVLLIEDDAAARNQLAHAVEKEGFLVQVAENGRRGLELFHAEPADIVFTDLRMPELDGIEVARAIKATSPDTQIIITTAFGETETVVAAIREGVLDYLKKPIDLDALFLALGRAKEKVVTKRRLPAFPTVLLAEDDPMTRERLARVLAKEHWSIVQATTGVEAVAIFIRQKIDVVLLDIRMPEMDGLAALHRMREISADFEAIVVSGYGDETSAIQAMRDGACNFIKKPVDLEQMIVAIEKAIERLTTERSLKFRIRELELAQKIIATITSQKQIFLEFGDPEESEAHGFARDVLDSLPMGLVVFDRRMNVHFANRHLTKAIQYTPTTVDAKFTDALSLAGVHDVAWETFAGIAEQSFRKESGAIETLVTGTYSYLTFLGLYLLERGDKQKVVMVAIRGERK